MISPKIQNDNKILGPKNILAKNKIWVWMKLCFQKKFWVQRNYCILKMLVIRIYWVQKILSQRIVCKKKIWSRSNRGSKDFWFWENFGSEQILDPKRFCVWEKGPFIYGPTRHYWLSFLVRASAWLNTWSCPSVCLSVRLFQLASELSRDIVARRRSHGAIFLMTSPLNWVNKLITWVASS